MPPGGLLFLLLAKADAVELLTGSFATSVVRIADTI
jgi:hypothetical protein